MPESINLKLKFNLYIFFLIFYSVFYLYVKHNVGNDSSISEWLINYQGGFTRRGLGGEINILITKLTSLSLRKSIFLLQSSLHVFYLILVLIFFRNLKINILQLFAIFTPIFLLYPIAEIEVLGRKEMVLFIFFIGTIFLAGTNYSHKILDKYIFYILPLVCLIWEEVVLYIPYILVILIFKNNLKTFKSLIYKSIIVFMPTIIIFIIIMIFPLSSSGHKEMCEYLLIQFGERCYMSASLLVTNTIYFDTFDFVHKNASFIHYFRYLMIFLVGFFPLNYLVYKNSFKFTNNFINKNFQLKSIFLILYIPPILLFLFGYDWGRWINITYTFSVLLYFYFLKNDLITNNFLITKNFFNKFFFKKNSIIIIFIIFSFGWNPKTVITGDIGSFPIYRIIYNSSKIIFNFNSFRLFENKI